MLAILLVRGVIVSIFTTGSKFLVEDGQQGMAQSGYKKGDGGQPG
jgi:hypothetical protein